MRMLFVTIIMYSRVANVDDIQYLRRQELKLPHLEMSQSDVQDFCLVEIEKLLHKFGRTLLDFPGLPILSNKSLNISSNSLLAEEVQYDHIALGAAFQSQVRMLNAKQGLAFHAIIDSIEQNRHQIFFIDGFGGTGKTFLWQVISLKLSRTVHSRFHIPIDVNEISTCQIELGSELAQLIENSSLIIWDEAPMAHKHCIESLDRTLRDVMSRRDKTNADVPFGGITVVFGGDFRQTLPIIPKATRTQIINSSIKRSYLWQYMIVIRLTENMRLRQLECTSTEATRIAAFSKWILEIETYTQLSENIGNADYFAKRAILAPFHEIVSQINNYIGTRMMIRTLGTWFIEVEILTGTHVGDRVYLPRLSLTSKQKSLDFTLVRRQYPIALSFAMTINKSQGQTLHSVGLCLKRQVFTHGQLYVALSRVTRRSGLKIISCDEVGEPIKSMRNIVFHEILED
ncbi:ATP-dependent DNA helicase PIF1 [Linum perenne]